MRIAREIDNKLRIAMALNNLGNLATIVDQFELAEHYLHEAVSLFGEIDARSSMTDTYLHLAKLKRRQGDFGAALTWLDRAWKNAPEETYHIQALFLEQAFAAAANDNFNLAATFIGFVDRQREDLGALNVDIELNDRDVLVTSIKEALSDPAYETAWRIGRNFDLPKAAARMLRP